MYMYIYTYIYITGLLDRAVRPTSLLTLSLLTLLESKIPGKSLGIPMDVKIPPFRIKIVLESNPRKSTMLVGGLGVSKGEPSTRFRRDVATGAAACL